MWQGQGFPLTVKTAQRAEPEQEYVIPCRRVIPQTFFAIGLAQCNTDLAWADRSLGAPAPGPLCVIAPYCVEVTASGLDDAGGCKSFSSSLFTSLKILAKACTAFLRALSGTLSGVSSSQW